jgi:hypothetical protein
MAEICDAKMVDGICFKVLFDKGTTILHVADSAAMLQHRAAVDTLVQDLALSLPGVELKFFTESQEELLGVMLAGVVVNGQSPGSAELRIGTIRMENRSARGSPAVWRSVEDPACYLNFSRKSKHAGVFSFFRLQSGHTVLCTEEVYLRQLINYFSGLMALTASNQKPLMAFLDKLICTACTGPGAGDESRRGHVGASLLYFERLELLPLTLEVTFVADNGSQLPSLNGWEFRLSSLLENHFRGTTDQLKSLVIAHYNGQAIKGALASLVGLTTMRRMLGLYRPI